jgi:hypothetical protein
VSENPFKSRPPVETDVLAEAMHGYNCRHHDVGSWDEATDQVKAIWRERARDTNEAIRKAIERRRTA